MLMARFFQILAVMLVAISSQATPMPTINVDAAKSNKGLGLTYNFGSLTLGTATTPPEIEVPIYVTVGPGQWIANQALIIPIYLPYFIVSDTCSNQTFYANSVCAIKIKFQPRTTGNWGTVSLPLNYEAFNGTTSTFDNISYYLSGVATNSTVSSDSNPEPPSKQECALGSIIRVDSQSLGETVEVAGAPFYLSYTTEFAASYQRLNALFAAVPFFNSNGWTVSIHHFYDRNLYRLFKGTGTWEQTKVTWADSTGKFNIPSSDGREVYIFDSTGKHLETKYGLTGSTKYTFTYDLSNRLSTVADAYGNTSTFTYSTGSYTITTPFGKVTSIALNGQDLISSITNPNSEVHNLTYKTGTDLLETFTKPGGQVSTFTYSVTGRLTQDLGHGGNFWTLVEDLQPTYRKVTMSSALGRATIYKSSMSSGDNIRYSEESYGMQTESREKASFAGSFSNNSIESVNATDVEDERFSGIIQRPSSEVITKGGISSTTNYARTYAGLVPTDFFTFTTMTDTSTVSGRVTTSQYSSSTKTFLNTSPEGATTTKVIDAQEKVVSSQSGSDTPWTYTYDVLGRLSQVTQGLFNTVTNTYNAAGLISSTTNARSETTSFTYDSAGRVTQVTRPDSTVIGYSYDSNGNTIGITPPGKLQHVFEFNAMELLSKYDPPALTGVTVKETLYNYNLDKQLTSIVRPDTQSAIFTYGTTTGLLDKVTVARGDTNYYYQSNTNLVSRIDSADGIRTNYAYYGSSPYTVEQRRSSDDFLYAKLMYVYDSNHRRASRSIRGGSFPVYSVIYETLNNDDRPVQIGAMNLSYSYPSGQLASTTLDKISDARTYDALGNLESYTASYNPTSGPAVVLYTYTLTRDSMSRVIGKTETIQGVTNVFVYSFDSVGRLTGVTKNGSAYSSYVYDDNGNRTGGSVGGNSITATYDAQDRLKTYNTRTYSYNANGDNTQIQYSPTVQSTFSYDAFGKLLTTVTPLGSASYSMDGEGNIVRILNGSTTLTRYIYDDQARIAGEFTDAGVMWRQFVYGPESHSPDYLIDSTGTVKFLKDHLGSPKLLVKVTDGTVLQKMDYDEFGRVLTNTNPTYQPFGFAGGIYLRLPGLVNFKARYYDAEIGRWTSKDPIRFDADDANLYGYVANDPINWIDPDGKQAVAIGRIVIPLAIRIGAAVVCDMKKIDKEMECARKRDIAVKKCRKLPFSEQGKCMIRAGEEEAKCRQGL